jgi:hypothetical protein
MMVAFFLVGGGPGGILGLALGTVLAAWLTRSSVARRRTICILCFAAAGYFLGAALLLSWSLRDGLGPDAIESSGVEAIRRAARDAWPAALISTTVMFAAWKIAGRRTPPLRMSASGTDTASPGVGRTSDPS